MKTRKRINKNAVYIVSFLLLVLLSIVYKVILSGKSASMLVRSEEVSESSGETAVIESEITTEDDNGGAVSVYVCGAVNAPGVYELEAGALINEAIELAGGFTEDAADEYIDLVYIIDDNMSVYIPTLTEMEECTDPWGNSDIYFRTGQEEAQENSAGNGDSGLININTAGREQLMTLPGIGEATADAIIAYREETPFATAEDIMNVSGIGESKYNRIRDLICV